MIIKFLNQNTDILHFTLLKNALCYYATPTILITKSIQLTRLLNGNGAHIHIKELTLHSFYAKLIIVRQVSM
jgi:hypothetical protein